MFCRALLKAFSFVCKSSLFAALVLVMSACNDEFSLKELDYNQEETRTDQNLEVWDGSIADEFNGGEGTAESPYLIANGKQLARFAAIVNGTLDGTTQNKDACGKLTADILLNNTEGWESWGDENSTVLNHWTPIGSNIHQFTGILDGDGHSISGIYINNSEANYQGLVGYLGEGGTLKNLGVKASYIKGYSNVGGVCGQNNNGGTVSNCHNNGSVEGENYVGGVCGQNNNGGNVSNCYNTGRVTGMYWVGGVCGRNYNGNNESNYHNTVSNCYNTGNVEGITYVGGVCGENYNGGNMNDFYNTVSNCYNTGSVAGDNYVGGVCGANNNKTTVNNCYNIVSNCYNTGNVEGTKDYVGGVCGLNYNGDKVINCYSTVTNCYNIGNVEGTGSNVGGVCGENPSGTVGNCYYLTGKASGGISGSDANGQAEEKTAEQFKSGEVAFLLQGEQKEQVWGQTVGAEDYPVLGGKKVVQIGDGYANELNQDSDGFYIISNADDLHLFASMVNGGQTTINVKLTADIELNNTTDWENWGNNAPANSWTPIGNNGNYYTGIFDGQGHTISGIYINNSSGYSTGSGLFGSLEGGTVENVGVTKSYIQGSYSTGGIVGSMHSGTIRNCYYTGIIHCQGAMGSGEGGGIAGIYGYDNITIENCYFTGRIISEYGSADMIGPIVGGWGAEYVNPTNCYYLDTCGASDKGTSKTAKQFKSGEVAYLLGEGWGQTIGTDNYPVLTTGASKKVYAYTMYQGQSTETGYVNNNGSIDLDLTSHPNTIAVFEAPGTFAGKNVVVKNSDNSYTCNNLVLTDNASFYTPVPFTAQTATYTRTPKVWAIRDSNGSGWETICIPFSGSLYADGNKLQPVDKDTNNGNYWLRSLTGFEAPNTLLFTSAQTAEGDMIKAGVPYLIALPGETFGVESLEGKDITVIGKNVAINNSTNPIEVGDGLFIFTSEYTETATENFHYRLNSELNGESGAGDLFKACAGGTSIPFRCRIEVNGLNIGGAASRSGSSLPQVLRIGQ